MSETVDADVVEVGAELVPAHAPSPALFGDDPVEVIEKASVVANALKAVIDRQKLYATIQGKQHITVDGWQLVGQMVGVTAVCVSTEPVDGGYLATVEARAADGRVVGRADALCTKHEKRGPWKSSDDYARLSMAQTRATSKALKGPLGFVVSLAGFANTPAEEMTFAEPDPEPKPKPEPLVAMKDAMGLAEFAFTVGVDTDLLQRAASHVAGRDVGDCTTKDAATTALATLTVPQAAKVEGWVQKKADEMSVEADQAAEAVSDAG